MENVSAIQFIAMLIGINSIGGLFCLILFFWMISIEQKEKERQKLAESKIKNN